MAGNATTHVIEIEKGVGEPTFIPLSLGQELAPISVGKRGMWRIEGAKVLDVHAFVYFDGHALFFQSADGAQPAMAEGKAIDSQWTELRAPCRIDIGSARLRYRSLIEEEDGVATVAREVTKEERDAFAREVAARRKAAPVPAPPAPAPPRPFSPGELVSKRDDSESTRYNPVDKQPARPMPRRAVSTSVPVPVPVERATSPNDETRMRPAPSGGYPQPGPRPVSGAVPAYPSSQPMMMGPAPMPAPLPIQAQGGSGAYPQPQMMGSGGYPQQQPPAMFPSAYPPGMPIAPGMMQPPGPLTGPGPMMMPGGVQTVLVNGTGGNKLDELVAQFNAASPPRKASLMLAPFAILAAMYIFFSEDSGVAPGRNPRPPGSGAGSVALPSGLPPYPMAQGQQYTGIPGTLPQTQQGAQPTGLGVPQGMPNQVPGQQQAAPQLQPQPQQGSVAIAPAPQQQPPPGATPSSTPSASGPRSTMTVGAPRTLERMAVDALASGDQAGALALYTQLMRENPQNSTFADAVRILQSRLNGAAPPASTLRP